VRYSHIDAEGKSPVVRRFIYAAADISEGEALTTTNIRFVRPRHGLQLHFSKQLFGRQARQNYSCGIVMSLDQPL
jgi:sialic acid synthase SpsE